jgi:hypothetical protein
MGGVVARLGHVLGWAGNGIAALSLLAGAGAITSQGWDLWEIKQSPVAYEVILPDGKLYDVIGLKGGTEDEASVAIERYLADPADPELNKEWQISTADADCGLLPVPWKCTPRKFRILSPEQREEPRKFRILSPEQREEAQSRAWNDIAFIAGLSLAVALVAFLLGRAFRYILSGPGK